MNLQSENLEHHKVKQNEVWAIYDKMKVKDLSEPYEFLPLDWLTKWLSNRTFEQQIDNLPYVCQHSKYVDTFVL